MAQPTAAPTHFPYTEHRNLAQVMRDEWSEIIRTVGERLIAEGDDPDVVRMAARILSQAA